MNNEKRAALGHLKILAGGCGAYLLLAPFTTWSQAVAAGEGSGLEEVVVTAQRRQERLQDVPISAVVVPGQTLQDENLNSLTDLTHTIPSVYVGAAGRSSNYYIRGIGSGLNASFDQSVGMFIDDVYHGRSRTSGTSFLDLDHVEVLKGPQSTFFGNNAIAGAFNIVTKKPDQTTDGWARVLYGQEGQFAAEGATGIPINDQLALRAAFTYNGENGWERNLYTGSKAPDERNMAGRLSALYKPSEDFDVLAKFEKGRSLNYSGLFAQIANCPPQTPFVARGYCAQALAQGLPTGLRSNENDELPAHIFLDTTDAAITATYRQPAFTLTSVSGFYGYQNDYTLDGSVTPQAQTDVSNPEHYRQFSQEFRIAGPGGQRLEYLAGLYYQTDSLYVRADTTYPSLDGVVETNPAYAPLLPYLPIATDVEYTQPEHVYSAFGSVSWNATEQLKLSAGLRGSVVAKSYTKRAFYGTGTETYGSVVALPDTLQALAQTLNLGVANTLSGSRSDHALMPSARLQYKFDADVMAYASYARGFKAGGFNQADTTGVAANVPFAPEKVNAYEVGLKSEWLEHTLIANVAVFRSDYTDLQIATSIANAAGSFISLVSNAAASRSQGVELDTQWAATRSVRLSADITYLDAYYVENPNQTPSQIQTLEGFKVQDLSGRPTEFSPKWSGNLSGAYTLELPGDYRLVGELTGILSSRYFLDPRDDATMEQGGYARLDGRLTLESPNGRWAVDAIGKNLTSTTIIAYTLNLPVSLGSTLVQKQAPSNWALQARYKW